MAGPSEELRALKRFVAEAEELFLAPHLTDPVLGIPERREVLNVAAFVVLTHGAFENFVEGVGLWLLGKVERSWIQRKRATRCTASLLLYQAPPSNETVPDLLVFDNLRTAIAEAKSEASRRVEQNNGIALRHLRSLFRPLGLDVPEDPVQGASLEMLVALRHQWAHQYRFGATVIKSAQDVKAIATDCLALAERVSHNARSIRP